MTQLNNCVISDMILSDVTHHDATSKKKTLSLNAHHILCALQWRQGVHLPCLWSELP